MSASKQDKDDAYSGLHEIEDAFHRVSSVADALLDSIRDDSLRGKQKRQSRRKMVNMTPQLQDNYDDDDDDTTGRAPNFDDDSIITYGDCDDLSLDGSLAQDMKNLKSVTRAMQKELSKEEKEFNENVSTGSARSYFERKQVEAETPATSNITTKGLSRTYSKETSQKGVQQHSTWDQFTQFSTETFGRKPNLLLLLGNIIIWAIFCKFLFNAKELFMDNEGYLSQRVFSLFMY